MAIFRTFFESFSIGIRQWRLAAIVWFFQLLLAMTIGLQVFEVFKSSIGSSLEIGKLLKNYDHTVISDFLKIHGASITPLIGQLRWFLLIYPIFAVFLHGGLLACAVLPGNANWRKFWENGATWFFPFLKISLLFFALAVVWTAAIWLPVLLFFEPSLTWFYSESGPVWAVFALAAIYLAGLAGLFAWSLTTRLVKIRTGASIFHCLRNSRRILWKKRVQIFGLLGLFATLHLLVIFLDWQLDAASPGWIFVVFVVQQASGFFRIQIRQMVYAGFGKLAI